MLPVAHALRELFAERTRVLLTILAIAWGTASITTMLALGEGLRLTFGRSGKGMGEGIMVVWPGQTSKTYQGLPEGRAVPITPEDLEAMRATISQLGGLSGEYQHWPQMRHGRHFRSGRVAGVFPDYEWMRNIIVQPGSRFIDAMDMAERRRVIVLGPQVAKELFDAGEEPVGQLVEVDGRPFLVVGVMRPKYQMSTYQGPDRDGTWVPATTFATVFNRTDYDNLVVKPRTSEQMPELKDRIRQLLARAHRCDPEDKEIVHLWDTLEQQKISTGIFYGLQVVLGLIGGLTLIVAGVGIANVMYVSVSHATRDIGIRMAVGARTHQVLVQYVLEALLATGLGGLLGVAASEMVVLAVQQIPMNGEFFEFVGRPVPVLSLNVALMVVGVLGVIGLLAGYFPARRAARVEPALALRYE